MPIALVYDHTWSFESLMNRLEDYADFFDDIRPWSGHVPRGFTADFLGTFTDCKFQVLSGVDPEAVGGHHQQTALPVIGDGSNAEGWFEMVNWLAAAREAQGRYVMITLGACYGAQAVGAYRAVQLVNPMPCKLVAVEPVPKNFEWIAQHMRTNGIDPDQHWLLQVAIGSSNDPVYFPVGAPGTGANNSYATNEAAAREQYVETFIREGRSEAALRNLIIYNSTGIERDLIPGRNVMAEIKLLSCVTLKDLISSFDVVDFLESDIQQSEILVFPPFIDLLRGKVRRILIGTHGEDVHVALHKLFAEKGWEIVFSYKPNTSHNSAVGCFVTNDGVLTVKNPDL
jgi:FkbM family methyltransferase